MRIWKSHPGMSPRVKKNLWLKGFSTSHVFKADPNNGLDLDTNDDILARYGNDKNQFDSYFEQKRESINNSHRIDSNNAAASGVPASELQNWIEERDTLLKQLETKKYEIEANNSALDSEYEPSSSSSSEAGSYNQDVGTDNRNTGTDDQDVASHNRDTGTDDQNVGNQEGPQKDSPQPFAQDSSDITQDDYTSDFF